MDKLLLNLKPNAWTKDEKHASNCNNKAMNGIYNGVSAEEFRKISTCKTAKETWEVLQTVYEGTDTMKQFKLQRLTKEFETIVMEEYETFDQFYAKLNDIANSVFILSEEIQENKIVKKILRSLPSRFNSKVDVIEENKNLDTLKVNQLVGNLQTFEANRLYKRKSKEKGIALKTSKESRKKPKKKIESDSESEAEDDMA
ncbi:hypothetical protein MRB53_028870 [Persea americana]|uniref:Uncharacterized protein n=1 Tax=Persea americana TaxID=3435 RepID=A0ACC2KGX9_PERAE|nr:hypothetical protein MRB53_028870 [Persea americana]